MISNVPGSLLGVLTYPLCLLILLSGCVPAVPEGRGRALVTDRIAAAGEFADPGSDPAAQALLAFAQFRLLAADDRWDDAVAALQRARSADPASLYLILLQARVYLHREEPLPAISLLNALLAEEPDTLEAHLLLGDIFIMQQQSDAALRHFHQAVALAPADESLHLRLAMAFVQLDRVEEALAALEQLLQRQPDAHQALLSLARIYRDNGQPADAVRVYRRYLEVRPGYPPAIVELGRLLEQQDRPAALDLYLEAIAADPYAPTVRQQLAQFYLAMDRPEAALEQLLVVRQQSPIMQAGSQIGLVYLHLQQWQQAEKEFRDLLDAGQQSGRNRYYLALALIGQDQPDAAMKQLNRIEPGDDVYRDAMLQLAYLLQQQDNLSAALVLLDRLLDQGYREPEVYYYLVAFHQEQDHLGDALAVSRDATTLYPDDVRLLYQLGMLYEAAADHQRALEMMETILLIDDNHADALNFLAYSQAESGTDLPLALNRAQQALRFKEAGYIEDTLGWVYFKLGRYTESRIHLERANALQPDDPVILEHLGDLYRAMNLHAEALQAYREVLDLDPGAAGVADKLQTLREEKR
ncbi:MAG: tetratricopeptide repeat protein [Pelovirga sp.]